MHDLDDLAGQLDVAVAVNSLVMPDVRVIDRTLCEPSVPASSPAASSWASSRRSTPSSITPCSSWTSALERGLTPREAERLAALQAERRYYDFAFGRFRYQGLHQKFWQPFEVEHRFTKAGFTSITLGKVLYPWDESAGSVEELAGFPRSWDWFFQAR